jgi:hypothetical protein
VLFSRNRLIAPTLTHELLQLVTELETVFEYNLPHAYSPRITVYRRTSELCMMASCHLLEHACARQILTSKKYSLRSCCLYFKQPHTHVMGQYGPRVDCTRPWNRKSFASYMRSRLLMVGQCFKPFFRTLSKEIQFSFTENRYG